jgi:hypothetical protein
MYNLIQHTEQELDELYAKLSETAQDFIFGGVISEEVANIGKETGLHLDKWQLLDTLVLETILGIVPSSMFASEVARRLGTDSATTQSIVSHMDDEIFSVIRDESVAGYAETNEKNINNGGAIYDEAQDDIARDPYREDADIPHSRGPVITEEKLHIVDELFAPYQPKVRELTPADGSVRVPTDEAPHNPNFLEQEKIVTPDTSSNKVNIPTSSFVITREMLEAEELAAKGEGGAFVGMDKIDSVLTELPKIKPTIVPANTGTNEPTIAILPKKKKIKLHIEKGTGEHTKLHIHIEKTAENNNSVSESITAVTPSIDTKKSILDIPFKTKPMDESHPSDTVPHTPNPHYTIDPYKEVL